MSGGKEIRGLSNAAVVELKAELFKQKEEFDRTRQSTTTLADLASATSNDNIKQFKKLSYANKKRLEDEHEARYGRRPNQKASSKSKSDKRKKDKSEEELKAVSDAALEASWVALQRKTAEYDRLKRNAPLSEDEDDDEAMRKRGKKGEDKVPLVDFMRKHLEKGDGEGDGDVDDEEEDDDPWVEATDAFGRTRIVRRSEAAKLRKEGQAGPSFVAGSGSGSTTHPDPNYTSQLISSDMSREQMRQEWERQAINLGTAFYALSQHEEERQKQMDALNNLRKDTMGSRVKAVQIKEERKAKLEERKALLRERKLTPGLSNERAVNIAEKLKHRLDSRNALRQEELKASGNVEKLSTPPISVDKTVRFREKQEKARERAANNYGMDGDPSTYNHPDPFPPRERRGYLNIHKPDYWNHPSTTSSIKSPPAIDLKTDLRHIRHMRGLAALRDYSVSQLHDWFFWVFTGVWMVMGSAFVFAVSVEEDNGEPLKLKERIEYD
ncbi:hypothetical protein BCR33DRAFT_846586 [Rhizoclosmatium globosum]|uniref:Uncharacterized protein n=1 Tax=Rhizoclosmatium globosum TaxID=329046 RepID=A0A1Y2CV76_9FUNG|nr:hypothetical protein BCR33DRAFT_846586 [Rhizoclosmatium globosum]|eukprot:ORY50913.1 hypothetical protein BCR33DRAFT_846586 [Rhizoclosmatium globosum]